VLGYAFYSWVYAAAGAMASRQDQVQSLAFPLALPVIFGYIVSLSAATSGNPSLLVHVLAYLPPTGPVGHADPGQPGRGVLVAVRRLGRHQPGEPQLTSPRRAWNA
jgi:ABC-2 type transport system permease protein